MSVKEKYKVSKTDIKFYMHTKKRKKESSICDDDDEGENVTISVTVEI